MAEHIDTIRGDLQIKDRIAILIEIVNRCTQLNIWIENHNTVMILTDFQLLSGTHHTL